MTASNATKNIFSKLTVLRDKDEEATEYIPTGINTVSELSSSLSDNKKRHKIRPEEMKKLKDEQEKVEVQLSREKVEEGFTEVRKGIRRDADIVNKLWTPEDTVRKSPTHKERSYMILRKGKRMFDRHSGTGRGREISKQGSGGKTTWGNIDQLAKQESINFVVEEEKNIYNSADENYFTNALRLTPPQKECKEETSTDKIKDLSVQEPLPEEIFYSHTDRVEPLPSKKEEKRRKRTGSIEEKEPEEKFERPEHALSYQEYLTQLKKKNEELNTNNKIKTVPISAPYEILKITPKESKDLDYQISINEQNLKKKKDKVKIKEKIIDETEEQMNRLVGERFLSNQDLTSKHYEI